MKEYLIRSLRPKATELKLRFPENKEGDIFHSVLLPFEGDKVYNDDKVINFTDNGVNIVFELPDEEITAKDLSQGVTIHYYSDLKKSSAYKMDNSTPSLMSGESILEHIESLKDINDIFYCMYPAAKDVFYTKDAKGNYRLTYLTSKSDIERFLKVDKGVEVGYFDYRGDLYSEQRDIDSIDDLYVPFIDSYLDIESVNGGRVAITNEDALLRFVNAIKVYYSARVGNDEALAKMLDEVKKDSVIYDLFGFGEHESVGLEDFLLYTLSVPNNSWALPSYPKVLNEPDIIFEKDLGRVFLSTYMTSSSEDKKLVERVFEDFTGSDISDSHSTVIKLHSEIILSLVSEIMREGSKEENESVVVFYPENRLSRDRLKTICGESFIELESLSGYVTPFIRKFFRNAEVKGGMIGFKEN